VECDHVLGQVQVHCGIVRPSFTRGLAAFLRWELTEKEDEQKSLQLGRH
jgi:hypothetical protein